MPLPPKPGVGTPRCLVTQIIEVKSTGWGRWKRSSYSKFHTSMPYILLCRTAGEKDLSTSEIICGCEDVNFGMRCFESGTRYHLYILLILHINCGMDTVGLRELIAANPEHVQLEAEVKTKEVKEPALGGMASLLTQSSDGFMDTQEEFYDALLVEDPEEEEEENAAQDIFAKRVGDKSLLSCNFTLVKALFKLINVAELFSTSAYVNCNKIQQRIN